MRVARIEVSSVMFMWAFGSRPMVRIETNLPEDARIVWSGWDPDRQVVLLNVTSETFDEVPELSVIPNFDLQATRHTTIEAELANIINDEHRKMVKGS
jgi:hypothetical protein